MIGEIESGHAQDAVRHVVDDETQAQQKRPQWPAERARQEFGGDFCRRGDRHD
jgi:hypothetical protein